MRLKKLPSYFATSGHTHSIYVLTADHGGTTPSGHHSNTNDVTAAAVLADTALVRGSGGARGVQDSLVLCDAGGNVTGVGQLTAVSFATTPTSPTKFIGTYSGSDTPSLAPFFVLRRARDGTPTYIVTAGDYLGGFQWAGGATEVPAYGTGAALYAIATEAFGVLNYGTKLEFWVCPNGSPTAAVKMRLDQDGKLYALGGLDVTGNIVVSGNVDGVDVGAHDVATTGVHGAGANTLLHSASAAGGDATGTLGALVIADDSHGHTSTTVTTHSTAHANDHTRSHDLEGASDHTTSSGVDGHFMRQTGVTTYAFEADYYTINFIINGGGAAITTGVKGWAEVPGPGVLEEWRILLSAAENITVDIDYDTYANFPTVGNNLVAPSTTGVQKNEATGLSAAIPDKSILEFDVTGAPATAQMCTVALRIRKT